MQPLLMQPLALVQPWLLAGLPLRPERQDPFGKLGRGGLVARLPGTEHHGTVRVALSFWPVRRKTVQPNTLQPLLVQPNTLHLVLAQPLLVQPNTLQPLPMQCKPKRPLLAQPLLARPQTMQRGLF